MTYWFTSDTHFGHANIIRYCDRLFKSVEHMNDALIRNWNQRVKPADTVLVLGDFCFRNTPGGKEGEGFLNRADFYASKLNGNKVFIRGSHDSNNSLNTKITSLVINMCGHEMFCVHDPKDAHGEYQINLVGHVHGYWKVKKMYGINSYMVNVGVDVWKFMPVNMQEILARLQEFKKGKVIS
jgi:calcineurin-like phosphoesterase family protein